jgi:hypothetical protein
MSVGTSCASVSAGSLRQRGAPGGGEDRNGEGHREGKSLGMQTIRLTDTFQCISQHMDCDKIDAAQKTYENGGYQVLSAAPYPSQLTRYFTLQKRGRSSSCAHECHTAQGHLRSSLSRREASEYAPYVRAQRLKQTDARPSVHALYTLPRTRVIKTAHVQQHYSSAGRLCTCNIFCSSGADTTHKQPKPKHVLVAAEGQCFKWSLLALVDPLLQDLVNHERFTLIFPGLLR